jgi:hypothetical protein
VEVGARTRTIPPALRRALQHRDQGCRFPGCGVRVTQGHHLRHWAQGPDGTLRFRRPDGRPLPEAPPPTEVPGDAVKTLRARHDARDLCLDARTTRPGWLGECLDLGWAIGVLHPRARPAMP